MESLSDKFVLSQYEYYRKNLGGGTYHNNNLIRGLCLKYEQECKKRKLI